MVVGRRDIRQRSQFFIQFPRPPREKTVLRFVPRQLHELWVGLWVWE
jgi:hypothetical protein